MVINVIIEGVILSICLYLVCALGIRNGAVNMVYLYEKDVQDRVVEMGLTTKEKIQTSSKRFKIFGLLFYFGYTIISVFVINGARGFQQSFLQMLAILLIMGVYDRIGVDLIWVGYTKAWIIPGTEDLMQYIPASVHVKKWIMTLVLYPAIAAIICGLMALVL